MAQRADEIALEVARSCEALDLRGRALLVAVSGGVDSTVLLHVLVELRGPLGLELAVAHIHHGLRAVAADADEALVRESAAALGLPFASRRVEPGALREGGTSRDRPTVQEAARRLRRDALIALARERGAQRIATAHQRDDQAETLLLRLFRGTGPEGLGGIPERSPDGWFVRPLLGVSRAAIEQLARERGLAWREDASNADDRYARNRLRHGLRALAGDLNPGWERALADLAEAQRRESEWLAEQVDEAATHWLQPAGEGFVLPRSGWAELPPALARRLLARVWRALGGGRDVSRQQLDRALGFLAAGEARGRLEWPGGLVLERGATTVQVGRATPGKGLAPL